MKLMQRQYPVWGLVVMMLFLGLPFFSSQAQARGGFRGGGFSGGSFRAGGGWAAGPRGGAVAVGPRGGAVAAGPRGGVAARGPGGATAYRAGGYYGPAYRRPVYTGLAVGTVIATLPAAAAALSIAGQRYYYDGSTYYQPCYQGTEVNYCVVADPNQ
jgi:hypothetical protein